MKLTFRQSILVTLCYSDIFDFPLTVSELEKWLFGRDGHVTQADISGLYSSGSYVHLPGRSSLVRTRTSRHVVAQSKWKTAIRVCSYLRIVPSISLVGITGALAMDNVTTEDDIDVFIAVKPGTLWITRFIAICMMEFLGVRRRPDTRVTANRVCLNMFMSEDTLSLPKDERDFFSAHELLQLKPLWQRGDVYRALLNANIWVKKALPNAWKSACSHQSLMTFSIIPDWLIIPMRWCEIIARFIQVEYMKKRRTTEVVTDTLVRFHPHDARVWIKAGFKKRLTKFKIALDKEIWIALK